MPDSTTENTIRFLGSLRRPDLAALVSRAEIMVGTTGTELVVLARAPQPFAEALQALPQHDRHRIAEAAVSRRSDQLAPADMIVKAAGEPVEGPDALLPDLLIHREMMIAVSTGGRRIQEVDDYYGARQSRIVEASVQRRAYHMRTRTLACGSGTTIGRSILEATPSAGSMSGSSSLARSPPQPAALPIQVRSRSASRQAGSA
jgi:hypothetical protein